MEQDPPTDGQTQETHVRGASGDRRRRRPPRLALVASAGVVLLAGCTGLMPGAAVDDDPAAAPPPAAQGAPGTPVEPSPWPTTAELLDAEADGLVGTDADEATGTELEAVLDAEPDAPAGPADDVPADDETVAPLLVPAAATGASTAVVVPAKASSRVASTRAAGLQALRAMPRTGKVSVAWSHPALGGHLGGVRKGSTTQILVNDKKLAGNRAKMRDVVRHEVAHIYQGQVMKRYGLTWNQLGARMRPAFGANAHEKAADCVARKFGARWTYYTASCGSKAKQRWVKALIAGRLP